MKSPMFCLVCKTQNPASVEYCEGCGEPLRPGEKFDEPAANVRQIERHRIYERNGRDL